MPMRMVICHLDGSKSNQVEQFSADLFPELSIGRDPGCTVQFDAAREPDIGGRHAAIGIVPGDPPKFLLRDLRSHAGTLLNGEAIAGETEILPGDVIQLGAGGPKFSFDVQPRPARLAPRIRAITVATTRSGATPVSGMPARLAAAPPAAAAAGALPAPAAALPPPAGRPEPRRRSGGRLTLSGVAGALAVCAAIGAMYGMSREPVPVRHVSAAPQAAAPPAPAAQPPAITQMPPPRPAAPALTAARTPDLAGTVRKIAGASRFMLDDGRWIELYGVDDPTSGGEHNLAVYAYLQPSGGAVECYAREHGKFACFAGGKDLAVAAIRDRFVRLTADAPAAYRALAQRLASARP